MAVKQTSKSKGKSSFSKKSATAVSKKSVSGKAGSTKGVIKLSATSKVMNKSEILRILSENIGITRGQADAMVQALGEIIHSHVRKGAVGQFVLPGILKVQVVHKPAVKAHKGINPFTKEEVMFKAKPARNVVKVRPLKKLKDMVQ